MNLLSWYAMPEFIFKPFSSEHIDYSVSYSMLFLRLFGRKIGSDIPEVETDIKGSILHKFQLEFNFYPDVKNKDSWVFTRAAVFHNGSDNNLHVQLGYSSSLAKLVGAEKKVEN